MQDSKTRNKWLQYLSLHGCNDAFRIVDIWCDINVLFVIMHSVVVTMHKNVCHISWNWQVLLQFGTVGVSIKGQSYLRFPFSNKIILLKNGIGPYVDQNH
jgi:hypothetical protein